MGNRVSFIYHSVRPRKENVFFALKSNSEKLGQSKFFKHPKLQNFVTFFSKKQPIWTKFVLSWPYFFSNFKFLLGSVAESKATSFFLLNQIIWLRWLFWHDQWSCTEGEWLPLRLFWRQLKIHKFVPILGNLCYLVNYQQKHAQFQFEFLSSIRNHFFVTLLPLYRASM